MSRDSNTPRHARTRRRPAGRRLQHAVLPVALGGVVAGSVWLAADAAAAPATHHPCPSDASAQSDATTSDGGNWDGSYATWRDGDGRSSYDGWQSRDGSYGYDGYDGRHDYYDGDHDWRDHTGEHWYADHSRVLVKRSAAQPHRATSTKTGPASREAVHAQVDAAQAEPRPAQAAPAAAHHRERPARQPRSAGAGAPPSASTSTARAGATERLSRSARSNLAAVDTTRPGTDYVTLYGAIGGVALAALLGMGGVAIWRRRGTG